jgi:hypothetical protein
MLPPRWFHPSAVERCLGWAQPGTGKLVKGQHHHLHYLDRCTHEYEAEGRAATGRSRASGTRFRRKHPNAPYATRGGPLKDPRRSLHSVASLRCNEAAPSYAGGTPHSKRNVSQLKAERRFESHTGPKLVTYEIRYSARSRAPHPHTGGVPGIQLRSVPAVVASSVIDLNGYTGTRRSARCGRSFVPQHS